MRSCVPLCDEDFDALLKRGKVCKIWRRESPLLKYAEPLFDLIHPRTMNRREVHLEAEMFLEPRAHKFSMMHANVVANEMDVLDGCGRAPLDLFEQFDELDLSLSGTTQADGFAGSRVERGDQVQCTATLVLMLQANRDVSPLRGTGRLGTRTRLDRGLFVHAQHALIWRKGTGVEVHDVEGRCLEGIIAFDL